jgi:A/G-specific adenine glycosylase
MELGALICLPKLPRCSLCPLRKACPSSQLLPSSSRLAVTSSRLRPAPSHQKEFILVAHRQGRIWLTQTHPLGRWRGLSLLPTTLQKPRGKLVLKIHYPFTRYMIHAAVYVVRQAPSQWPGKWFSSKQLRHATLPAPHRKILETLGIG